jgi:hypothetical protein
MNKQKLLCLADTLDKIPEKSFDGWEWAKTPLTGEGEITDFENIESCGTQCCIAGWAVLCAGYKVKDHAVVDDKGEILDSVQSVAAKELGLTFSEKETLFYPNRGGWESGRAKDAAKAIRRFVNERK